MIRSRIRYDRANKPGITSGFFARKCSSELGDMSIQSVNRTYRQRDHINNYYHLPQREIQSTRKFMMLDDIKNFANINKPEKVSILRIYALCTDSGSLTK